MRHYLYLTLSISLINCQNLFSCDAIQDDKNSSVNRVVDVSKVICAENSSLKKYLPKDLNCGTFEGFKASSQIISLDQRVYEFMGGSQIYRSNTPVVKKEAKDVLPSTQLERPLPLHEASVDLNDKSLLMTFKYQDASLVYTGYSYTFTVKTKLDDNDLTQGLIESIVNKFIPSEAKRSDFNGLKKDAQCIVENKPYSFVIGKLIFKDHEEFKGSPEEVLPNNLWGNGWRPNHQLKNFSVDLDNSKLQLTYHYVPSVWYRGTATHFAFSIETPLDKEAVAALQPHASSILVQKLYHDLTLAFTRDLLTAEEYLPFAMQISNLSLGANFSTEFNELKASLEKALSPMTLFSKKRIPGTVFIQCEQNKTLDTSKNSIDQFIAGFSLKN